MTKTKPTSSAYNLGKIKGDIDAVQQHVDAYYRRHEVSVGDPSVVIYRAITRVLTGLHDVLNASR